MGAAIEHSLASEFEDWSGDDNAVLAEQMYRTYQPELLAYCRRRLNGDAQAAADVAQETFTRIISARRIYQAEAPRSLIYRIAGNLCIDHVRRQGSRRRGEEGLTHYVDVCDAQTPERIVAAQQELAQIEATIVALPPRCQQVYILHRYEGMSYAAISAYCGISLSVVEKHMAKALKRIMASVGRG